MKPSNRNHILLQLQCTHTHFYLVLSTAIGAGWTSGDFGKGMLEWFVVGTAAATSRTNWLVLIIAFSMIGRIKSLLNSNFSFPSPEKIGSNRFLKNVFEMLIFLKLPSQSKEEKRKSCEDRIPTECWPIEAKRVIEGIITKSVVVVGHRWNGLLDDVKFGFDFFQIWWQNSPGMNFWILFLGVNIGNCTQY